MHRRLCTYAVLIVCAGVAAFGCGGRSSEPTKSPAGPSQQEATIVDVPIDIQAQSGQVGTWNWVGQSVTVTGGSYYRIRFNWYLYAQSTGQPTAFGVLYILDREYLGLPGDLSTQTPGFIARSQAAATGTVGGQGQGSDYAFDDGVILQGGRQYWFYTSAQGAFANTFDQDSYPGGMMYATGIASQPFRRSPASGRIVNGVFVPAPPGVIIDANFRLRGLPR